MVYRLLEYSLKEELIGQFGKEKQIEIFRNAGRKAGEYFAKKMLNLDQPLDQFVSELQSKMQELKIGVLRIEKVDEESGKIILNVSEDADCSGLPILGDDGMQLRRRIYRRYFKHVFRKVLYGSRGRLLGNR